MKLTYWIADCLNDSPAYSIRCRTRREVKAALADPQIDASGYSKPYKVVVEYKNALDLLNRALGEGGLFEERNARIEIL